MRQQSSLLPIGMMDHGPDNRRSRHIFAPDTTGRRLLHPGTSAQEHQEPRKILDDEQNRVTAHFQDTAAEWREIYDRNDELYSLLYQERKRIVLSLVDGLGLKPEARALDVGCGPGLIALELAGRGLRVDAIDVAPAMVEMTRDLAGRSDFRQRVRTSAGDVRDLGFAGNSFDLVLAVGVTEWLGSLDQALGEVARVLKPGGFAVITADNRWSLHYLLDPVYNPLLAGVRRRLHDMFLRLMNKPRVPRYYQRSVLQLDRGLRRNRLNQVSRMALGFGPLHFFGKKVCSEATSIRIHRKLQVMADRNWPVIALIGRIYIAVAQKPG